MDMKSPHLVVGGAPAKYHGYAFDEGEIFEMNPRLSAVNERCLRLGHFKPFEAGSEFYACGKCDRRFATMWARDAHGRRQHPDAPEEKLPTDEEINAEPDPRKRAELVARADAALDDKEREHDAAVERNPIDLTQTQAAKTGKVDVRGKK